MKTSVVVVGTAEPLLCLWVTLCYCLFKPRKKAGPARGCPTGNTVRKTRHYNAALVKPEYHRPEISFHHQPLHHSSSSLYHLSSILQTAGSSYALSTSPLPLSACPFHSCLSQNKGYLRFNPSGRKYFAWCYC